MLGPSCPCMALACAPAPLVCGCCCCCCCCWVLLLLRLCSRVPCQPEYPEGICMAGMPSRAVALAPVLLLLLA